MRKINVSLDTLDKKKFQDLTGSKEIQKVKNAVSNILKTGLLLKINTVILKDFNEDDIIPLVEFACDNNVVIRFIEYMEFSRKFKGVPVKMIKKIILSVIIFCFASLLAADGFIIIPRPPYPAPSPAFFFRLSSMRLRR